MVLLYGNIKLYNVNLSEGNLMIEKALQEILEKRFKKNIGNCSNEELYIALLEFTKDRIKSVPRNEGKKKLYYISAVFLI